LEKLSGGLKEESHPASSSIIIQHHPNTITQTTNQTTKLQPVEAATILCHHLCEVA